METTTKIKQYIRHIAPQPYTEVRLGRVVSVEGDTCTIDLDGLEIDGVSLRPVQDSSNLPLRITPAVGAFAIVADLSETLRKAVGMAGVSQDLQDQWLANVSRFAAYKAARATDMIREAVAADGVITDGINPLRAHARYLAAEANTARTRARTGKQWQQFSDPDHARLFPNIRWIASRSATPREAHMPFYGRVWAKDDPFWQHNQPGTLWNCKCDWEETDDPVTTGNPQKNIEVPGLKGNPAETGQIFSEDAPYIAKASKIELDETTKEAFPHLQQLIETDTKQYRIDYYNDGGGLLTSSYARIEEGNTGKQELQKFDKEHNMCRILAQNKHDVVYLRSREGYYDILIDGIPADLKKTKSHNHIVDYAKKAIRKQHANIVIFEFEDGFSPQIWDELNKVKSLGIPCYYFTSTEKIVHIL